MANVRRKPSKQELEKSKLNLEIADLRKPVYHKLGFYAVVGPTLLALGTLGLGYSTGLFNAQRTLLQIEQIKLKDETEAVKKQREVLEKEKSSINHRIAEEKQRLQTTLDSERAKMNAQLAPLRNELATVKQQIAEKNRELAELPIKTLLDQMAADTALSPFNQSSRSLIELLKKDKEKVSFLDKRLAQETDPIFKANVLYVTYQATREPKRLQALFDTVAAKENVKNYRNWVVIGVGSWQSSDAPAILNLITVNAPRIDPDALGDALQIFHYPRFTLQDLKGKLSLDEQATLFSLGKELALSPKAHSAHRLYGILTASFFVHQAFPILAAAILDEVGESDDAKANISGAIREIRNNEFDESRAHIRKALNELDFPKELPAGLAKWRTVPTVQKLSSAVLGPDPKVLLHN